MGVLGWSPDQFWGATVRDLSAGIRGYIDANGGDEEERKRDDVRRARELMAMPEHARPARSIRSA